MSPTLASLLVIHAGEVREQLLGSQPLTVGRDPGNDLVLGDAAVSRRHLVVEPRTGGGFVLRDVGSSHGTFVLGQRVTEHVLAHDDEIVVGTTRLRYREVSLTATPGPTVAATRSLPRPPRIQSAYEIPDPEALQRQYEKLRVALEVARSLIGELDLDALALRLLETALELTGAECGALMLVDESQNVVSEVTRWRGDPTRPVTPSSHLVREVLQRREPVVTHDPLSDERFQQAQSIIVGRVQAAMSVPLIAHDDVVGILQLEWRGNPRRIDERDVELVLALAAQGALAIRAAALADRAQRAKAAERARLERALSGLPVGLVVLDGQQRVALANPLGVELLEAAGVDRGAPVERFGPRTVDSLIHASERGAAEVVLDGPRQRLVAVAAARAAAEGGAADTVLVFRDVSAERERETQLSRQERLLLVGRLAGGIAHDFNNILAVITSCSELLVESAKDDETREDASEILRNAKRGAALVRHLMDFNRREPGRVEVLDAAVVVKDMQRLLLRILGADCSLEVAAPPELFHVRADRTKLEQLLLNLVVNARDAMPRGGSLRLSLDDATFTSARSGPEADLAAGDYVVLHVTDTGEGMAPETVAQIFEPFFTTKEAGRGTGLGLATVYNIVKQAGGAIAVRSGLGEGTTFSVYLPRAFPEPRR